MAGLREYAAQQEAQQKPNEATEEATGKQQAEDETPVGKFLNAHKRFQENTRVSEELKAEILKGLQQQADIKELFLKAAKALTLLTDEETFYTLCERELSARY